MLPVKEGSIFFSWFIHKIKSVRHYFGFGYFPLVILDGKQSFWNTQALENSKCFWLLKVFTVDCKNNVFLIILPLQWISTVFCFPCLQTHCFQQGFWIDGNLTVLLNTFILKTKENKKQISWGENRLEVTWLDILGISQGLSLTKVIQLCLKFHIQVLLDLYVLYSRSSANTVSVVMSSSCAWFFIPRSQAVNILGFPRFPRAAFKARVWPSRRLHSTKYSVLCH